MVVAIVCFSAWDLSQPLTLIDVKLGLYAQNKLLLVSLKSLALWLILRSVVVFTKQLRFWRKSICFFLEVSHALAQVSLEQSAIMKFLVEKFTFIQLMQYLLISQLSRVFLSIFCNSILAVFGYIVKQDFFEQFICGQWANNFLWVCCE